MKTAESTMAPDQSEKPTVTMVATPDDGSCGVGTYAGDLINSFSESVRVTHVKMDPDATDLLHFAALAVRAGLTDDDIVHVQYEPGLFGDQVKGGWPFFALLGVLSWIRGITVIVTVHGVLTPDDATPPMKALKVLYIRAFNALVSLTVDEYVFLSDNTRDDWAGVPPAHVHNVPHGVNIGDVREIPEKEAKARFGFDEGDTVVTEPGFVRPSKGQHRLVKLAARFPECEFLIAGGSRVGKHDEYVDELRETAPENVTITGILDDDGFHAAFNATDVAVLPYFAATSSGIFNWCAAYGLPVVGSNNEYFHRIEAEWGCVETFSMDEEEAMVDSLKRVLTDDKRRRKLSENITQYREQNSFEKIARLHEELYHTV